MLIKLNKQEMASMFETLVKLMLSIRWKINSMNIQGPEVSVKFVDFILKEMNNSCHALVIRGILGSPFLNKCKLLHLAPPLTKKEAQVYKPFQVLEAAYFILGNTVSSM